MPRSIEIENIEELRRREGIEDVELREDIRELQAGHLVKLTFFAGASASGGETLVVRITSIRGGRFRGKLVDKPISTSLGDLQLGAPVTFTSEHIHSLVDRPAPHES